MSLSIILFLASGLVLLLLGGEFLVRGAVATGLRMGLTPLAAGMTIVAFGTSAPELVVNLRAAAIGEGGLAVGNVIGSNIANIGLILGLSVLIKPVKLEFILVRNDIFIMVGCTLLVILFLLDGTLSRLEGVILVSGIIGVSAYNLRSARKAHAAMKKEFEGSIPNTHMPVWLSATLIVSGLIALTGGGVLFVKGAVELAQTMGAPPALIGLTVVAIGTSLPELATSVVSSLRGYGDMVIGNVVGSNTFNMLFVLGLTSMWLPLSAGKVNLSDYLVMLGFTLFFIRLMHTGAKMDRWEGAALLACFILYIGWLFTDEQHATLDSSSAGPASSQWVQIRSHS